MMQSIIFDVDGTLWDTTEVVAKAWNRAVEEAGVSAAKITAEVLKKEFGKTMDVIAQDLFPNADAKEREHILELCCKYEHEALIENNENLLFPNVKETLEKLSKKYSLFIVSNCQSGYIELFMKKAGVEKYITDIECFGNTNKSKGNNIKLIIERNKLRDAVYVGDTQGDYEATKFAGIPFIYAKYGFGKVDGYYLAIEDISELLDIE
ncbi:HAD family hydrolase [Clostridium thermarum]|uniref:HAD family hydrolase n=1 Tax=Clostridium thermarum TaxID=1716543 RepID=UPI001120B9C3|nr:HAD family hydrolase [Clostridium thermarum]